MTTLAENIKRIREQKEITLDQVAAHMGEKVQMIKMWEYGNVDHLDTYQIMRLAEFLGTKPSVLMGWEEE